MENNDCEICKHIDDMEKAKRLLIKAIEASIYSMIHKSKYAFKLEQDARAELDTFFATYPHVTTILKD